MFSYNIFIISVLGFVSFGLSPVFCMDGKRLAETAVATKQLSAGDKKPAASSMPAMVVTGEVCLPAPKKLKTLSGAAVASASASDSKSTAEGASASGSTDSAAAEPKAKDAKTIARENVARMREIALASQKNQSKSMKDVVDELCKAGAQHDLTDLEGSLNSSPNPEYIALRDSFWLFLTNTKAFIGHTEHYKVLCKNKVPWKDTENADIVQDFPPNHYSFGYVTPEARLQSVPEYWLTRMNALNKKFDESNWREFVRTGATMYCRSTQSAAAPAAAHATNALPTERKIAAEPIAAHATNALPIEETREAFMQRLAQGFQAQEAQVTVVGINSPSVCIFQYSKEHEISAKYEKENVWVFTTASRKAYFIVDIDKYYFVVGTGPSHFRPGAIACQTTFFRRDAQSTAAAVAGENSEQLPPLQQPIAQPETEASFHLPLFPSFPSQGSDWKLAEKQLSCYK